MRKNENGYGNKRQRGSCDRAAVTTRLLDAGRTKAQKVTYDRPIGENGYADTILRLSNLKSSNVVGATGSHDFVAPTRHIQASLRSVRW